VTAGAGSDKCGSANLVDEWLQVQHALSIENFFAGHPLVAFPSSSTLEGVANCVIGGIEHSAACVRHPEARGCGESSSSVAAEDVHSGRTRQVTP
jgi:hypothetical protein